MEEKNKTNNNSGCVWIGLIFFIGWGLNGLIWGNGFFEGIFENITVGIKLCMLGLTLYGFYKLFLDRDKK